MAMVSTRHAHGAGDVSSPDVAAHMPSLVLCNISSKHLALDATHRFCNLLDAGWAPWHLHMLTSTHVSVEARRAPSSSA